MYKEAIIRESIQKAVDTINKRAETSDTYMRGYNDCFALMIEYERALRGALSLSQSMTFNYKTPEEFLPACNCKSFDEVAEKFEFSPVNDRVPLLGDIAVENRRGIITAMLSNGDYWISTSEDNSGVQRKRRTLFKEIRPLLHVRPKFIGE